MGRKRRRARLQKLAVQARPGSPPGADLQNACGGWKSDIAHAESSFTAPRGAERSPRLVKAIDLLLGRP